MLGFHFYFDMNKTRVEVVNIGLIGLKREEVSRTVLRLDRIHQSVNRRPLLCTYACRPKPREEQMQMHFKVIAVYKDPSITIKSDQDLIKNIETYEGYDGNCSQLGRVSSPN